MINEQIRAREVRVISDEGEQLGIMPSRAAVTMAREKGLDLVCVSPMVVPPVCRIMDYGRHKYETEKKTREAKKKQHIVMLKELTLSYRVGEHDYQVRKRSVERFLEEGNKVKMTVRLRGREEQHADMAAALLRRFYTETQEVSVMEREPRQEGRHVIMILAPKKENK